MVGSQFESVAAETWQHIGPVPEAEARELFEDPYAKTGFKDVDQGYEQVSAGEWLVSSRFAQCSARILINQVDGSALMKHVGPTSIEVFGGGESGLRPQDEYLDFLDHAEQMGAGVWAINILGDMSYHSLESTEELKAKQVQVDELPDIRVDSGTKFAWAIAYNPATGEAIVRTYDDEHEPSYEKFQLPTAVSGLDVSSAARLSQKVEQRRLLKRSLRHLGNIPLSSPEYRKLAETRAAILGSGALVTELRNRELESAEIEWTRSFVRKAEIASSSDELSPGLEALELFMDVKDAARPADLPLLRRVHALSYLAFSVVMKLEEAMPEALPMGGPALLGYLDAELAALQATDEGKQNPVVVGSILDHRALCEKVITTPRYNR